jgi:GNAT superfamily N-acetyltransferase
MPPGEGLQVRFELRPLAVTDVAPLAHLAAGEGWASEPAMFRDYLRLHPGGCHAAVVDGVTIGGVTTIVFGTVGWVGNLLVSPEHRGCGVGSALLRRAAETLERRGVETVYLEAVPQAQRLYLRADFTPRQEVLKMERRPQAQGEAGPAGDPDTAAEAVSVGPDAGDAYAGVAAVDRAGWGVDRGIVLGGMYRDRRALVAMRGRAGPSRRGDACAGFIMAAPARGAVCLGPWGVARHAGAPNVAAGEALLAALMADFAGQPVVCESPTAGAGPRLLERWGFLTVRTNLIMGRGPGAGEDFSLVYALASAGDMG